MRLIGKTATGGKLYAVGKAVYEWATDSSGKQIYAGDTVKFVDYIAGKGKVKVTGIVHSFGESSRMLTVNGDDGKQYIVRPMEVKVS